MTAEGIETLEQARILCGMECETLTGHHIGLPMPAAARAIP